MYAYFSSCDCIFVETTIGGGVIPPSVWQLASESIFCQVYRHSGAMGNLEYFVVGNNVDGYHGMRGSSVDVKTGPPVKLTWKYEMLAAKDCRNLVNERWR